MSTDLVTSRNCCIEMSEVGITDFSLTYLPKISKWVRVKSEKDELETTIDLLAHKNIMPFTQDQEKIFQLSKKIEAKTVRYLSGVGYSIIVGLGLFGGLAGVRIAKMAGYDEESLANDFIPFTISSVVGVGLGVVSMLFTGTFPDQKSDAADAKERECLELEKQFNEASCRLVSLFWSKKIVKHEKAKKVALALKENMPIIKKRLLESIQTPFEDERITHILATAVEYIVSNASYKVLVSSLDNVIKVEKLKKSSKRPPCLV
jgi:hypothetical protein